MAESTLGMVKSEYEVEIADMMGWGRDSTKWSTDDNARIKRDFKSALHRFYHPVPPHDWSFLRQFASITLLSGAQTARLPDDCAGVEGNVNVSDSGGSSFTPIKLGNPNAVKNMYTATPSATGRPQIASLRPVRLEINQGQRSELYVYPEADQAYTLEFQYYITPDYLVDNLIPYPHGGAEHSETILEACLAVAEERRLNIPEGSGPHGMAFAKRMLASQALDRRKKPQWIGTNLDWSDEPEVIPFRRGDNWTAITINGIEYT